MSRRRQAHREVLHGLLLGCVLGCAGHLHPVVDGNVTHGSRGLHDPDGLAMAPRGTLPSPGLSQRLDLVADAYRGVGAHTTSDRWATYLRESSADTLEINLTEPRCVGFIAVGAVSLGDVNLTVSNVAGIGIGRDVREDAHPYVRVCPTSPTTLYLTITAVRGSGEVGLLALVDPPLVSPPLDDLLGVRPMGQLAGPRTPRATVGADPGRPNAVEGLHRITSLMPSSSYTPIGDVRSGTLAGQHSTVETLALRGDRCYVILGAGGPGVDDLDLVVAGPDRQAIGRDTALDAHPAVRLCPRQTGPHSVEVRMFAGSGQWALGAVEITPPARPLPDDITGVARARAMEIAADAARRGLTARDSAVRASPWDHDALVFPFPMRAGHCYLAGAAAGEILAPIETWLSDATGAVLASDTSERERTTIFHCADRDQQATVTVRTPGGRGEYVYEAFESRGGEH